MIATKVSLSFLSLVLLVVLAGSVYCSPDARPDASFGPNGTASTPSEAEAAVPEGGVAPTVPPRLVAVPDEDAPAAEGEAPGLSHDLLQPAMRVYRDPSTGRIGPPPAGVQVPLAPESVEAASTSGEGLVEEPSPVEGGGTMIDLQGRFQSVVQGHVDPDGEVGTHCDVHPSPAGSGDAGGEG